MANRNTQNHIPSSASNESFKIPDQQQHPSLRAANSFPLPTSRGRGGGMGGRRLKPNFKLSDIDAGAIPSPTGGGASGAGLGMGRPSLGADPPKRPSANSFKSPFSNFDKIVFVSSIPTLEFTFISIQRPIRRSQF
jgi:hypothetical protein